MCAVYTSYNLFFIYLQLNFEIENGCRCLVLDMMSLLNIQRPIYPEVGVLEIGNWSEPEGSFLKFEKK